MKYPVRCKLSSVYSWLLLAAMCGVLVVFVDVTCAVILAAPITLALVVIESVPL